MRSILTIALATLLLAGMAMAEENVTVGTGILGIGGYIQSGYYMTSQEVSPPDVDSTKTDTNTFLLRRARIKFSAEIIEDIVGGVAEYDFVNNGIVKGFFWLSPQWEPMTFEIGRTQLPWMAEQLESTSKLLWVDRSLVADRFNYAYDYGLKMAVDAPLDDLNSIYVGVMYSNGYDMNGNIQPVDFDSDIDTATAEAGVLTLTDNRTDLKDIAARLGWTGILGEGLEVAVGGGVIMNKATRADVGNNALYTVEGMPITGDLGVLWSPDEEGGTLTVKGAYAMDDLKQSTDIYTADVDTVVINTVEDNFEKTGMMGGAAYNFPVDGPPLLTGVEPTVRYASFDQKQTTTPIGEVEHGVIDTTITQITGGVNLYAEGHNAKLQINYVMEDQEDTPYDLQDPLDPQSPWVTQPSTTTKTNQIQLQFQVAF